MKIVLVTGAAGGIGLEVCKKFKKNGWTVVGTSRTQNLESEFIDLYLSKDLSLETSPKEIIEEINEQELV